MYCKIIDGYWTVVRGNVHHNHQCDSLRYQGNPWVRRLTDPEFETVRPLLISGTAAFHIKNFVYQSYGKRLTDQDVCNLRYKVLTERDLQNEEEDEENRLCDICNLAQPPCETGDAVGWVFCPREATFHKFCAYDPSPNVRAVHCPICGAITN
ncbi:unnamed protein product [Schistosoma curassoni]|uniref:RING-type domain-containing protein n=1 Tax=Schistosoma curassoni TaxID=6186 RepID=A0A183KD00_9TREM|nr:unnamed protein product [Schistosoma curassoni]